MNDRRSDRTFVSYIDKSRDFYAAHGYEKPYAWAHYKSVPFQPLLKPLAQSRVGLVTTADWDPGETLANDPRGRRLFAANNAEQGNLKTEKSWDKEATHTDDPESFLPIERLKEFQAQGRIGSLSERFYGVPTDYSQRMTREEDTPQLVEWLREDDVDVAILLPL